MDTYGVGSLSYPCRGIKERMWALMRGIIDIITAFQVKKVGKIVADM